LGPMERKPFKRNHFIPRVILEHWVTRSSRYLGVWVYDIPEKRKYFAEARGKKAFSFAALPDLYIPKLDDSRLLSMEKWFASQEAALASLLKQVKSRQDPLKFKDPSTLWATQIGIQAMAGRSRYDIEVISRSIEDQPELREIVGSNKQASDHQVALENLIHLCEERAHKYNPLEIDFFFSAEQDFLMCDRPLFYSPDETEFWLVMTNRLMLNGRKSHNLTLRYRYNDVTAQQLSTLNELITQMARYWIMAKDEKQLDQYITLVKQGLWRSNREREEILVRRPQHLRTGWRITK